MTSVKTLLCVILCLYAYKYSSASMLPLRSTGNHKEGFDIADDNSCVPPPKPILSVEEMKLLLSQALPDWDKTIKEILKNDSSPGGVVLSLVYKDKVLRTGGYGLKDMKGAAKLNYVC